MKTKSTPSAIKAPRWLTAKGQELFVKLMPQVPGYLPGLDEAALAVFCDARVRAEWASEEIHSAKSRTKLEMELLREIRSSAFDQIAALAPQIGMTPRSRLEIRREMRRRKRRQK